MSDDDLQLIALVAGLVTAGGGLYLAGVLLRTGRPEASATSSRLPSAAVFGHGTVALLGLLLLFIAMRSDSQAMAWATLATLVVAALIGAFMFLRWTKGHRGPRERVEENRRTLAEQQLSPAMVHTHGALAGATLVLVLLLALGIGT